ncbi:hypothetical protein OIO90_001150 [Microbotryomycetes sp. JL221]|nr:hypothetical protein OIO90_001150 [Microbotryomycetes sp. JL221]
MSDAYHKTGGSLKLKGGPVGPANKKKKKTKSTISERARHGGDDDDNDRAVAAGSSSSALTRRDQDGDDSDTAARAPTSSSGKTEAQLKFEAVQKKRLLEKAAKAATKSHKDRVAEFNAQLERLSEHHDMPRIGPG